LNQTPSVLVAFVGPFLKMESIATAPPTATPTKHEALRDAEKFLEKLNETWRGNP
jgi:hypothetical protein